MKRRLLLWLLLPCLAAIAAAPATAATAASEAASAALPAASRASADRNSPTSPLSYAARIRVAVRRHLVMPTGQLTQAELQANPMAEVEVKTAPDGSIVGIRLSRSSGVADWDTAVLRAVEHTQSLPLDRDGRVPPVLFLAFRPY